MVERVGKDSALAREAMQAALRRVSEHVDAVSRAAGAVGPAEAAAAPGVDFARSLEQGLEQVDVKAHTAESMPVDLLTGKVDDFHEIAVQLKSAELSFRFAMEIRNKLVDAYREIMRMSV
jgi:flagellar hook-basal body complex protein FliE